MLHIAMKILKDHQLAEDAVEVSIQMKKLAILLSALFLILNICACSPSGKIPSLEEIVENGTEWGNEQLQQSQGWTLADLEKVWGKADGELSGMYGCFWKVNDNASVTVLYYDAEIDNIRYIAVTEPEDKETASLTTEMTALDDITQTSIIESDKDALAIVNIIDRTKTEGLPYDMAEEKFFEDGDNEYYFSGFYSRYVIVHYGDGSQEDIVTALNTGKAIISDLDKFGVSYTVKPSGMGSAELPNNPISQTEAEEAEIK